MAFTPFIDDLALVEVLLLLGAAILAYGGVMSWWAIRTNNPKELRYVLHGMAIPLGSVGVATTVLALWGEMTWPFLMSDGMGGYNIFFFDAMLLFGLVTTAYAIAAYLSVRMQYIGLFALVAGGVTVFYGYTGYGASFTKDPFETFLLYAGFGLAGIFAFPATIIMDYFLAAKDALRSPWMHGRVVGAPIMRALGNRGVQPVVAAAAAGKEGSAAPAPTEVKFHVPYWVQTLLLLFPVFAALAAIAALWYFGITLPGHLGGGPSTAP